MLSKGQNSSSVTSSSIETHPLKFYNFQSRIPFSSVEKLLIQLKTKNTTKEYILRRERDIDIDLKSLSLTIPMDVPNIDSNSDTITASLRTKWINEIGNGFKVDFEIIATTTDGLTVSKVFDIRVFPFSVQNFMLDLSFIPSKEHLPLKLSFKTFIFLDRTFNRRTGITSCLEHAHRISNITSESVSDTSPISKSNSPPTNDDKSSNSDNSVVVIDSQKNENKISFVKRISKFLNIKRISVLPKYKERSSQSSEKSSEMDAMINDVCELIKTEEREKKKYTLINDNLILKNEFYITLKDFVLLNQENFKLLFSLQNLLLEKARVLLILICNRTLYLLKMLTLFRKKLGKYKEMMADVMEKIECHKTGKRSLLHQKFDEMHILKLRNKGYYKQNYNVNKKHIKILNNCEFLKDGSEKEVNKLDVLKKISESFLKLRDKFNDFLTSSELLKTDQVKILDSLKGEYMGSFEKVMKNEAVINKYRKQEKKLKKMKREITKNSKTNDDFCIFNSQLNGIQNQNRKGEISDTVLKLKKYYSNKLFINRFLDFYTEQLMEKLEKNSPTK